MERKIEKKNEILQRFEKVFTASSPHGENLAEGQISLPRSPLSVKSLFPAPQFYLLSAVLCHYELKKLTV